MLRVDLLVEWKFHLCSAWAGAGSVTARGCSGACVRRRLVRHLAAGMVVIGTARRGSPGTAWEARGAFSFLAYLEIIKNIKNYWFITVIMQNIHLCLLPVYQPISSLGWQGPKPASKPLSDWLLNLSQPWICLSSCMWLLVETVIECGTETGTKLECTNLALNLSQSVTICHKLAQKWHIRGSSLAVESPQTGTAWDRFDRSPNLSKVAHFDTVKIRWHPARAMGRALKINGKNSKKKYI